VSKKSSILGGRFTPCYTEEKGKRDMLLSPLKKEILFLKNISRSDVKRKKDMWERFRAKALQH